MRVNFVGISGSLRSALTLLWDESLHAAVDAPKDAELLVQDGAAPADVLLARLENGRAKLRHHILISTYAIYPTSQRHTPWSADEVDACTSQFPALVASAAKAREAERSVQLWSARTGVPYTIIRPALLEDENDSGVLPTRWFADRIIHGGVIVLPAGGQPLYRVASEAEVARAIVLLAGQEEAFGKAVNVAGQAILSAWGHAALVRDALGLPLQFAYVPRSSWDGGNLTMPADTIGESGLIEPSPILHRLGWEPDAPFAGIFARALHYRDSGGSTLTLAALQERALATREAANRIDPLAGTPQIGSSRHFNLKAWGGRPASLHVDYLEQVPALPRPLIEVKLLALGPTEEKYLKGDYSTVGSVVVGHNAVLEVVQDNGEPGNAGNTMVAVPALGCGDPACGFCVSGATGLLGVNSDGYGIKFGYTPKQHLVPVPVELGKEVLLANPLAALLAAMEPLLDADEGPIWIAGQTAEASLAIWLAEDAGRPVICVDRQQAHHASIAVHSLTDCIREVEAGERRAPTLAIDFTDSVDIYWPLSTVTVANGHILLRGHAAGLQHGRHWHLIAAGAPNRARLEQAVAKLQVWRRFRNLGDRLHGPIPLERYWEALLPPPFQLGYIATAT